MSAWPSSTWWSAGVEALLMRWQFFYARNNFLGPDTFNQLFTMHGTTMVFFMGMPILIGIGNYLVPLMIGARDMAFPRLNALGFWVTLFGGLLAYFSFAVGGAPAIGWFAYAPLTEPAFARGPGTEFWALGLIVSGIGTISAAVNFVATILGMRAPGMTMSKIPFFVWTMLWTSVQILIAIPPLTAALVMVLFDRNFGAHFFDAQNGGSALLWQHLFWFFGHPGGLHPDPAGVRHDHRGDPRLFAEGAVRLRVHGRGDHGDRLYQPGRVGPSYVLRRHEPHAGRLFRRRQPARLDSHGHQILQLAGDDVWRPHSDRLAHAVCLRIPVDVFHRRADGHHAGRDPVRFSALRQLFRRRPFSLGADRRHAVRHVCRHPLLVSQSHWPDALRAAGPLAVLAVVYRLSRDVRADAHLRAFWACRGGSTPTR